MKKSVLISIALVLVLTLSAKKVKFEVDMTDQTISTYGVHVSGDFQALAGYSGGDWQPGTTPMVNEPGTQIYSVVVDIPAFSKYEYKFLNGDQWYDVEFVPMESRVGYNFNDNRWIFIDSITNDTTTTYPILYSGNAPAGLKLLRLKVDLQKESIISPSGIHVAGSYQGWDPSIDQLCDFDTTILEHKVYLLPGYYEYKYFNGNSIGTEETIPFECAVNGSRWVNVVNDTVLEVVCFGECSACVITGLPEISQSKSFAIYPNPASLQVNVKFNDESKSHDVFVIDFTGRIIRELKNYSSPDLIVETSNLEKGTYFVKVVNESQVPYIEKLIIK